MRANGFTLLEVVIALAIVALLVVTLLGGLRIGLEAWRVGEDRAELHQRIRGVVELLHRSVASTYPYRGKLTGEERVLLFRGTRGQLDFVTQNPPVPPRIPLAFSAVSLRLGGPDRPGLTVVQKPLPNDDPFEGGTATVLDPDVVGIEMTYLDPDGEGAERWEGSEGGLPTAVRIALTIRFRGRDEALPTLFIPLPTAER